MSPEQARELLSFHDGSNEQIHDPRWENGFLGMLRPYRGLREDAFHEVMRCIEALADELRAERVDRIVISSLWGICHLARLWGIDKGGMLRRNRLIASADVRRLEQWIDCISYATMMLVDGGSLDDAFDPYRELERKRRR